MPRLVRIDVGYYERLCEEGREAVFVSGRYPSELHRHACQRLEEIKRLTESPGAQYDEEKKILIIKR